MADDAVIDQIATQIADIESGGKYDILGPVTSKGDRAHGKYQIMGANIPSWTKEALGEEYDPQRFLTDPDAQEKTARFKMGQYFDQYGTPEDVASMWHSGLPYKESIAAGRKDQLGTTTESYGARVRSGVGVPSNVPSPDRLKAFFDDINVPQEAKDQVGRALRGKIGGAAPQPAIAGDTGLVAQPSPTPQAPLPAESPQLSVEKPWRGISVDEAAAEMNTAVGNAPDAALGQYGAAIGKPISDALKDVYDVFFNTASPAGGDPTDPATWFDGLDRALKLLHPLGVPAEIAGNLAFQALNDSGADPNVSSALATLLSVGVGAKTPIPGLKTAPGSRMPLQGTQATRAAAAEAGAAREVAEAAIPTARAAEEATVRAGETAVAQADELATTARATAEDAARQAEATAGTASPSPEAAGRARATLTPRGTTATEGSAAVTAQLERELADVKDPVQGIYNALVEQAEAQGRTVAPEAAETLLKQIDAITEELGATLAGQSKSVINAVKSAIEAGEPLTPKLIDAYKQQLDSLMHGRVPHGATPKTKALYDFKWEVRDMMRSMYDDEERAWAEVADTLWRDTIIGKDSPTALGNLVRLAKKNPQTFVERVFGTGAADKQGHYAASVMRHLDDATKTQIREATLARAIDNATDAATDSLDPRKLLTNVGKYSKSFYDSMVTPEVDAFFKVLKREQAAVAESAGAASRGSQWATAAEREAARTATGAAKDVSAAGRAVTAAEREAAAAGKTAERAVAEAAEPNRLARMSALGLEIGGVAAATHLGGPLLGKAAAGAMGARRALQLFIPRASLARALADSPTANLLTRALQTPFKSKASIAIINELRNRNTSVNFLGGEDEEK
jgi:hypothetical protein